MDDPTCLFCAHRLDGRSKKFCTTCLPPYGEWQDKREYQRRYQILWCAIGHGTTGMEKCRIPKGHPARVERRSVWRPKPSPPGPCHTCGEPASGPQAKWCNGCRRIAMYSVRQANGLKVQARIRSERPADWKPVESCRRRQRMAQRAAAKRRSGTRPTTLSPIYMMGRRYSPTESFISKPCNLSGAWLFLLLLAFRLVLMSVTQTYAAFV